MDNPVITYRVSCYGPHNRLLFETRVEAKTRPEIDRHVKLGACVDAALEQDGVVAVKFERK